MERTEAAEVTVVAVEALKATSTPWHAFNDRATVHERRYQLAAERLFRTERADVSDRILASVPSLKAVDDPHPSVSDPYVEAALLRIAADYAPGGAYHEAWLARYRTLIGLTMQSGARTVGSGLSFRLQHPQAQAAVRRRVTKLTGNVTETTVNRIRDVVRQAMTEGSGVTEIARRIRDEAFDETVTTLRARTIARTESVGALNEGAHVQAMRSGVMQSKRWLTQADGRVRESHVRAGAEGWIAIGDVFVNGLQYPHDPSAPADEVIQCRCGTQYSDLPPNEAKP